MLYSNDSLECYRADIRKSKTDLKWRDNIVPRRTQLVNKNGSLIWNSWSTKTSIIWKNWKIDVHCKLKSQDIILAKNTGVEYDRFKYQCGKYFSCKTKRNDHHCNCMLSPNYEHRRKIVTKADDKYCMKLKMEKLLKSNNSKKSQGDVDDKQTMSEKM